jgi:hypothetical protein
MEQLMEEPIIKTSQNVMIYPFTINVGKGYLLRVH